MLEFEKKILLTQKEYQALCSAYRDIPVQTQVNYYYDTEDLSYNRTGVTCRIREKNNSFKATVKKHSLTVSDCSHEKTAEVKNQWDTSAFEGMGVTLQGSLVTQRKEFLPVKGVCVAIDKNKYLGTVDYELELEYDLQSEDVCHDVLQMLAAVIKFREAEQTLRRFYRRMKESKSKSGRFFARKMKIQKEAGTW